jgi:3-hydroxybutyryl-CoA dehydrogenase
MKNIAIIGSGTMGLGIAQVFAEKGFQVKLYDNNTMNLTRAEVQFDAILEKLLAKSKIDFQKKNEIKKALQFVESLNDLSESDLIIEAIIEDFEIKKILFSQIEPLVSSECIIASNTSSLSITGLAGSLEKASRFIGIHFFNPAALMPLVEIIPGNQTEEKLIEKIKDLLINCNKTPVIAKDTPGFIVNKIARSYYGESIKIYEEGIANFETIDFALKKHGHFKMGPFELMDMIGNDINFAVSKTVWEQFFYDERYKPSITQQRLVQSKKLGRKTGSGYYDYTTSPHLIINEDDTLGQLIFQRVISMLINEAYDTLYMRIANAEDIETAMTKGVNYPKGLLLWGKEIGLKKIVQNLDNLFDTYHENRYRASVLLRKLSEETL